MKIISLASDIYDEIQDSGISIPFIRTWLTNNINKLNLAIDTNFCPSGQAWEIQPEISGQPASIMKLIFMEYYYNKQVASNVGASAYRVIKVVEGDTQISKVDPTNIAKVYQVLAKENRTLINEQVKLYRLNLSVPREVNPSGNWEGGIPYYPYY